MDHEYSLTGKITDIKSSVTSASEHFQFKEFQLLLVATGEAERVIDVNPSDKSCVAQLSDDDVAEFCKELSLKYQARAHFTKLHEEYGLLNVFNGGSDYEVVASDRFTCEYDNGSLITREKVKC